MGNAHATLYVSLPSPDPDRGVVWHHRCVYTPPDCLRRLNLCSWARCVRAWPGAKQPAGGGGHTYIWQAQPQQCWVVLVAGMVNFSPKYLCGLLLMF